MNNLSNSGLMDEDVTRNFRNDARNDVRKTRLSRTSKFADDPEATEKQERDADAQQQTDTAKVVKSASSEVRKNEVKDDKILGMNKFLFWGITAALVGVGGYFAYVKFIKKGAGNNNIITPAV